jgi:phospholipid/cholesterol/gamma-HCH transport system substrate-binding protein
METRANHALIGLFTLIVIALGFGFTYWFGAASGTAQRAHYTLIFGGSVSGLSRGSIVSFNGIPVGEVSELKLLPEDPRRVVSIISVDRSTPVKADTRARLEYQGLTGVAQVSLSGGDRNAGDLLPAPGQSLPTIFADRSDFQDLLETARNIARRADDVFERLDKVVGDNQGSITRTIQNIERFSDALGNNSEGINQFLAQVGAAAERIGPLSQTLDALARDFQGLTRAIDPKLISQIVENANSISGKFNRSADRIDDVLKGVEAFLGSAAGEEGKGAFNEIASAARSIRTLADNLDRRTAEIAAGINRFTGPGLREVEALASDSRRTLNDINRTVKSLERNPQQLIFGKNPPLPEYKGAR